MKKEKKKFLDEFKEFAMRGNIVDLAVGVVIGGAFNKIVSSLVKDIIMPVVGVLTGGVNFEYLTLTLKAAEGNDAAVVLNYGVFIQNIVDFLIIAFSVFIMIKLINKFKRKSEEETKSSQAPEEELKPSNEEKLLTEIRDLLKDQNNMEK